MKLHHSVLLTLAACAATGYASAENVIWNYSTDATMAPTDLQFPTESTETITKTGTGTLNITLGSFYDADNENITNSASGFGGDVYINEGTIKLGEETGGHGDNQCISGNALGSSGTIHVAGGAKFLLSITASGTVEVDKAIQLEGGTLEIFDGGYNLKGGLKLTADSTLHTTWSKGLTINGLDAEGKKLTMTQDHGGKTYSFKGAVKAETIDIGSGFTVNMDSRNNGLTSLSVENISIGANSTLNLHTHTAKEAQDLAANVTLGSGATLQTIDGAYKFKTLALTGDAKMIMGWDKSNTFEALEAEGHTLTLQRENDLYGTHGFTVTGDAKADTLIIHGNISVELQGGTNSINHLDIRDKGSFRINGAGRSLSTKDITLAGGATLMLETGSATGTTIGAEDGVVTINATTEKAAVISSTIYGTSNFVSRVEGKGQLKLTKSPNAAANWHDVINFSGQIKDDESGKLSIVQTGGDYAISNTDSAHTNSYSGGTTLEGGTMTVKASYALGTGEVKLKGGTLVVEGITVQGQSAKDASYMANTFTFLDADDEVVANMDAGRLMGMAAFTGVTLTQQSISGGSIMGGAVRVSGALSIDGVEFSYTDFDDKGGTLSLTNVAFSSTNYLHISSLTEGSQIIDGTEYKLIKSDLLSGLTMTSTGKLDVLLAEGLLSTAYSPVAIALEGISGLTAGDGGAGGNFVLDSLSTSDITAAFGELEGYKVGDDGTGYILFEGHQSPAVPEPATATLSLLALAALAARRRRK